MPPAAQIENSRSNSIVGPGNVRASSRVAHRTTETPPRGLIGSPRPL
jgi:hypothetical protein